MNTTLAVNRQATMAIGEVMADGELKERWVRVHEKFRESEAQIKTAERFEAQLGIPSINELRYVCYHALRARMCEFGALEDQNTTAVSELDKADRHCDRATYDAFEIQINWYSQRLRETQEAHARSQVTDIVAGIIPDYAEDIKTLNEADDFLKNVRLEHDQRDEYYEQCRPYVSRISEVYNKWRANSTAVDDAIRRDRKRRFWTLIWIFTGIVAAIAAAATTFILWYTS